MPKLTKRTVDSIKPTGRDFVIWDDAVTGFGLRTKPSGTKSYVVQYRNGHGISRRFTLGKAGHLTPEQARKQARGLLGDIAAKNADPAADKRKAGTAATVADLCDEYLQANKNLIKTSTLVVDRSRIDCHVRPLLGTRRVASLTIADIERFQADVASGKTSRKAPKKRKGRGGLAKGGAAVASRTVGMLATILQRAVRNGVISINPARGVKRPRDKMRKPAFSFEALSALGTAIRAAAVDGENQTGLDAIKALALTGCRRMEVLTLRKSEIDLGAHCIRFADTKTGAQMRPIGEAAVKHLRPLVMAAKGDYIFTSSRDSDGDPRHFVGLPHVWERVCARASLSGVTLHGLRHWFASAAAAMNFSELVIAGMLGHRPKGITSRYATAPDPALIAAADRVSNRIAMALEGRGAKQRSKQEGVEDAPTAQV